MLHKISLLWCKDCKNVIREKKVLQCRLFCLFLFALALQVMFWNIRGFFRDCASWNIRIFFFIGGGGGGGGGGGMRIINFPKGEFLYLQGLGWKVHGSISEKSSVSKNLDLFVFGNGIALKRWIIYYSGVRSIYLLMFHRKMLYKDWGDF